MREHKQSRIILSLLLGFILLALCLPVCAFAEDAELSDGDETGISLTTSVPPSVISGAGAAYQKGSASGLTFKTDDATDNLLRVLVDGQVVSSDKYSVSGEPLTITLHAAYLDTLSAGEHTIEIVTTNGSALTRFTVRSAGAESPGTGDERHPNLWLWLMAFSVLGLAGLLVLDRRHRRSER